MPYRWARVPHLSRAEFVGDRVEMLHVWVFDNPDGAVAPGLTRTSIRAAIKQLSNRR